MNPYKQILMACVLVLGWTVVGYAQQTKPTAKPGETLKIQGEITEVQTKPATGSPMIVVKATDGKEYLVYVGPTSNWARQGFNPKVGDKVTVTGQICCQVDGKAMVHTTEIVLGGKTYANLMVPGGPMGPMMGGAGRGPAAGPGVTCCGQQATAVGCCQAGGCPGCPQR